MDIALTMPEPDPRLFFQPDLELVFTARTSDWLHFGAGTITVTVTKTVTGNQKQNWVLELKAELVTVTCTRKKLEQVQVMAELIVMIIRTVYRIPKPL